MNISDIEKTIALLEKERDLLKEIAALYEKLQLLPSPRLEPVLVPYCQPAYPPFQPVTWTADNITTNTDSITWTDAKTGMR